MQLDAATSAESRLTLAGAALFLTPPAYAARLEAFHGASAGGARRTATLSRRQLRLAVEYVRANLTQDIGLEDIAGAAGMSPFHFARLFKNTTGMSPYRYLMRARVEQAKALLRNGEQSLARIAAELGFADQSHMTTVFRRFAGTTPKAFKNSWSRPMPS